MGRGSHSIDRMAPDYEDRQKTWGRKQKETKQPGEVCFSEGRKEDGRRAGALYQAAAISPGMQPSFLGGRHYTG